MAKLAYSQKRLAILGRYQWSEAQNNFLVADPTRGNSLYRLPNARAFRRQAEAHTWYAGKILNTEVHFFSSLWGRHLAPSVQSLEQQTNESLYGDNKAFSLSEIFDKRNDSAQVQYTAFTEKLPVWFSISATRTSAVCFFQAAGKSKLLPAMGVWPGRLFV